MQSRSPIPNWMGLFLCADISSPVTAMVLMIFKEIPMSSATATTPRSWYSGNTSGDQALVICEATGKNIAVCYSKEDAPLVSAAPDLLKALKDLLAVVSVRIDDPRIAQFNAAFASVSKAEPQ